MNLDLRHPSGVAPEPGDHTFILAKALFDGTEGTVDLIGAPAGWTCTPLGFFDAGPDNIGYRLRISAPAQESPQTGVAEK